MANRKTLHICVTAGPYGNETPVSLFRLVDTALGKGYNVNVLAYEDAVLLTSKARPSTTPTSARLTTRPPSSSPVSWRRGSKIPISPGTSEGSAAWNGAFHRAITSIRSFTEAWATCTSSRTRPTRPY